jgi:hypothetical protein
MARYYCGPGFTSHDSAAKQKQNFSTRNPNPITKVQ